MEHLWEHIEFEMDGERYCIAFDRSPIRGITKIKVHTRQVSTKQDTIRDAKLIDATPHILIRMCEVALREIIALEGRIKQKFDDKTANSVK